MQNPVEPLGGLTHVATALGTARIVLGLGYMLTPKFLHLTSFGPGRDTPELQVTSKMLGSREVYMGATVIAAARSRSTALSTLLLAGAMGDAWDAITALKTKNTTIRTKIMVPGVAASAAIVGVLTAARASTVSTPRGIDHG